MPIYKNLLNHCTILFAQKWEHYAEQQLRSFDIAHQKNVSIYICTCNSLYAEFSGSLI